MPPTGWRFTARRTHHAALRKSTARPASFHHRQRVQGSPDPRNRLQSSASADGDFTLGQAFEATGFPRQAALAFQRVYFSHPAADLSERARPPWKICAPHSVRTTPALPGGSNWMRQSLAQRERVREGPSGIRHAGERADRSRSRECAIRGGRGALSGRRLCGRPAIWRRCIRKTRRPAPSASTS